MAGTSPAMTMEGAEPLEDSTCHAANLIVMAELVPAIHVSLVERP